MPKPEDELEPKKDGKNPEEDFLTPVRVAKPLTEIEAEKAAAKAKPPVVDDQKPPKPKANEPLPNGKKRMTIVMPDGHTLRKKRAIDSGLSELILPPYTKGKLAVYRVFSSNRIDPATKLPPEPKDVIIEGTYVLYDKFEADPYKKQKLMQNFGRRKIVKDKDGKDKIEEVILDLEFRAGIIRVDVTNEYPKYVFMELHPLNASNRHRNPNNAPIFERIDIKSFKSEATIAAEMDLSHEAEEIVMKMPDKDKIIGMAVSAGVYQQGLDAGALKNALRKYAREKPRAFFGLTANPVPSVRLNILDALTLGLIDHNPDTKTFVLAEEGHKLHTYLVGDDPIESFVQELLKPENHESYQALVEMIDYWQ